MWFSVSSAVWDEKPLRSAAPTIRHHLTLHAYTHRLVLKSISYNRSSGCYDNIFSSWTHFVNNNTVRWCWLQRMTKTSRRFVIILSSDHGISILHRQTYLIDLFLFVTKMGFHHIYTNSAKSVKYMISLFHFSWLPKKKSATPYSAEPLFL